MSFLSGLMKGLGVGEGASSGGLLPLALGGLSLLGGDDSGGQQRQSFHQKGSLDPGNYTDPVRSLQTALDAILRLGGGLQTRPGVQLRSSVVQPGPSPVNIPGIPFQIGGGLGMDPAMKDPTLLQADPARHAAATQFDPFQSIASNKMAPAQPKTAQRRQP